MTWIFLGAVVACLLAVALISIVIVIAILARQKAGASTAEKTNLTIDVAALDVEPVSQNGPTLEIYGTPVRLVAFIIAPSGRGAAIPNSNTMRIASDNLVPGLAKVLDNDRPIFRRWPNQLSTPGFAQSFFANMMIPGDKGKGTCWCGVAGKFSFDNRQLLAGLVLHADQPNAIGTMTVEHEGKWNDILRIRNQA